MKTAGSGKSNRAIALGNRGAAYKVLGRYEEAIADFSRAIELDSDNSQYYCQRGDARLRKNANDEAIADYTLRYGNRRVSCGAITAADRPTSP